MSNIIISRFTIKLLSIKQKFKNKSDITLNLASAINSIIIDFQI